DGCEFNLCGNEEGRRAIVSHLGARQEGATGSLPGAAALVASSYASHERAQPTPRLRYITAAGMRFSLSGWRIGVMVARLSHPANSLRHPSPLAAVSPPSTRISAAVM